MNITALQIHNLSKTFPNGTPALSDVNLNVKRGEFVSLIGTSGCGKSTLFSIIAGIEKQTSGDVLLDGKIVNKRAGKFGYMLQQPLLLPWRTVVQNMTLGLQVRGIPHFIAEKKALFLLKRFELLSFETAYPSGLSGGMSQRVALLRTVLFHKEFLLLDEPFGALDALTRLTMQLWLMEVYESLESTVLFVTHDIREAILLSDRIYVMGSRPGTIIKEFFVSFPRPRKPEMIATPNANRLEKELLKQLEIL